MKILNLDDFMSLPSGILFSRNHQTECDIERHTFTELAIKGDSRVCHQGYDETILEYVDFDSSTEYPAICENMIKNKESRPINRALQTADTYNKNEKFLIFERDDIDFILDNLNKDFYKKGD